MRLKTIVSNLLAILISIPLLARGDVLPPDEVQRVRAYTRQLEFNYVSWIADALFLRSAREALGANRYLQADQQKDLVFEILKLTSQQEILVDKINRIYADPSVQDVSRESALYRQQLSEISDRIGEISPTTEAILQSQVGSVVAALGLASGGQPIPPVWYHSTELPLALIVSPRQRIETSADISLEADLKIDQVVTLENSVAGGLDVSALVVPVGGIGIYPTMVMQSADLSWLTEVISHEWIHNYLTLRPLGMNFETSPELRTMNETTAAIAGKEIGREVVREFYPELAAPLAESAPEVSPVPPEGGGEEQFNFNKEMHAVRVQVDALLAEGKITEAEQFMEARRQVFVENGYAIRKLNQAYFAFYGAYADVPGGAAGEDPVGPAVRSLRQKSASLAAFLQQISRMTSFEELRSAVNQ